MEMAMALSEQEREFVRLVARESAFEATDVLMQKFKNAMAELCAARHAHFASKMEVEQLRREYESATNQARGGKAVLSILVAVLASLAALAVSIWNAMKQ